MVSGFVEVDIIPKAPLISCFDNSSDVINVISTENSSFEESCNIIPYNLDLNISLKISSLNLSLYLYLKYSFFDNGPFSSSIISLYEYPSFDAFSIKVFTLLKIFADIISN